MSLLSLIAAAAQQSGSTQITQQMADDALTQGFALMGYGLAFVFMALVILYGFVKLMTVVFREKPQKKDD